MRPPLLRAAALLLLLGGSALVVRSLLQHEPAANIELLSATTARSESDTIYLDDGSVVILAAATRLEYPRRFEATSRTVRLTGEALFQVASDTARPFTVLAGNASIRVVGTQFVTRTLPADSGAVSVALVEGVVAVRSASGEVLLQPGQVAHVSSAGSTTVSTTDLDAYLDWTEGRLVFDDAPISDVLAELQRWYPVEFRADANLSTRRVSARLRRGSLEETIGALALALDADVRRSQDTITFTLK